MRRWQTHCATALAAQLVLFGCCAFAADARYLCLQPRQFLKDDGGNGTNRIRMVAGIPFVTGAFWRPAEGGHAILPLDGLEASNVYILGGLNSVDVSQPGWGGGNGFENFFFGSRTGEIRIHYASGRVDTVPMIVGYTTWFSRNYRFSPAPFNSDTNLSQLLDKALCVANGREGYRTDPGSYFLALALRPEKVAAIELCDSPAKTGYFEVNGISFAGADQGSLPAPKFSMIQGEATEPAVEGWLKGHTIDSANGYSQTRKRTIDELRLKFDTQPLDINYQTISRAKPDVTASNFDGPKVEFGGSPTAELMTRIYYENAAQMAGRVDKDGRVHESARGADYFGGMGTWTAGLGAFYDDSYTRIRAVTLLSNLGYSEKANAAIDYYDKWLMYFPEHYPQLQLGGKPVPAHATVIANAPLVYFDKLHAAGWPTRYKTHDFGNGENDGHGMLMLSRWRAWLKQGRSREWVDTRWNSIQAAAEYIPWCLSNPALSYSEHGLLYSESEGGMQKESMFCDLNCYLGLLGSIEMAKATGRTEWAGRWQKIADAYLKSMDAYYPTNLSPWGDVWDPNKTATWAYGHATLAPVFIGMDYWGYDVMNQLPPGWKERTMRTYKMQMTKNAPPCAAPAGMGYGQGYITEAGLLLDQMQDASRLVDWMAKLCFAPRLEHPYRVPEGSVVESDGSIWRRWGDLGNLYQLGEVEYTIQVILGIDDINPRELVLMPRLPLGWDRLQAAGWPVRTFSRGKSCLVPVSLTVRKDGGIYTVVLASAEPIDRGKIRIGPFSDSLKSVRLVRNGRAIHGELFESGDSKWVWLAFGDGRAARFEISATAQ